MNGSSRFLIAVLLTICSLTSCNTVDDDRIPSWPVNINLGDAGIWNSFGVWNYGQSRSFIRQSLEPAGFSYPANSATGFGGVLLIMGMNTSDSNTMIPLAYDLSCPVERQRDITVYVDPESFEAVCPVCESHYEVTMAGGAPVSGPALTGSHVYGLRHYRCLPAAAGGYIITN